LRHSFFQDDEEAENMVATNHTGNADTSAHQVMRRYDVLTTFFLNQLLMIFVARWAQRAFEWSWSILEPRGLLSPAPKPKGLVVRKDLLDAPASERTDSSP
jgi:hypothetical protein